MRQYLRLLHLPALELQNAVEMELNQNPVLEEKASAQAGSEGLPDGIPKGTETPERGTNSVQELEFGDPLDKVLQAEGEMEGLMPEQDGSYADPSDLQKTKDYQETLITQSQGLSDFLLSQIRFLDLEESELLIAQEIIGNLNEDGYLTVSLEEIATASSSKIESVEEVLAQLQGLDPPGICARTLQECLILQLRRLPPTPQSRNAIEMVLNHFGYLAKRDWDHLSKKLSTSTEDVKKAFHLISSLEPKPGRISYHDPSLAVSPDATVSFDENEAELQIEVHHEYIPELRINPYYRKLLRNRSLSPEARQFIREKVQAALNFINALQLRKSTLRDITEQIVKMQPEFFRKGFSHLKPMRLKDVASRLGIHESTVSRALNGKYISTPQGMIPFKGFFSSKLETESGEEASQKSILQRIKHLLAAEDPTAPLSDQAVANLLKSEGIKIARRTVAKYREMLRIFPAHMRRNSS